VEGWRIRERVNLLAAVKPENGSPEKEEGHVGTYFGGYFEAFRTFESDA
jgi:hypothetical protein